MEKVSESIEYHNTGLQVISARKLIQKDFDETTFLIPDILPLGNFAILAGRPKLGKSFLALDMAVSIAYGGYFLGKTKVNKSGVLYMALEDNERRMQGRLKLIDATCPDSLMITTEKIPHLNDGGLDLIVSWLRKHPDVKLIIIDVLEKIRPPRTRNGGIYNDDYSFGAGLQGIVKKFGITVLGVHHFRKAVGEDPFDNISGSLGLTGSADTLLILNRARGMADSTLQITGRDLEEKKFALKFDTGKWLLLGDAREYEISQEQREILDYLQDNQESIGAKPFCSKYNMNYNSTRVILFKMYKQGLIDRDSNGRFSLKKQ